MKNKDDGTTLIMILAFMVFVIILISGCQLAETDMTGEPVPEEPTTTEPNSRPPVRTCAAREGTYAVSYLQLEGTCGETSDQTVVVTSNLMENPACSGRIETTNNNCTTTITDFVCLNVREDGSFEWSDDGFSGLGYLEVETVNCRSVYEVKYVKVVE